MSVMSGSGGGRGIRARLAGWLPSGASMDEMDFISRHHVVTAALALHLPVVLVVALVRLSLLEALLVAALPAAALAVALVRGNRRRQTLAAGLGLLTCSAVFVHLSSGQDEVRYHYFLAVALIALYQDWTTFLLAVGFVVLQHGVMGALDDRYGVEHGGNPWAWAAANGAFIFAFSVVQVLAWRQMEKARARETLLRHELLNGRSDLMLRLEETERIRRDLIAMVSHEFRTPLTGIRAATLTLLKRRQQLDAAAQERLLNGLLDQEERLSRLLENMLTAAQATSADASAVADVQQVATEVAMIARSADLAAVEITVAVPSGTLAYIERQALHQVLANLVDNARTHGTRTGVPLIAGGYDEDEVWFTVSNEGSDVNADAAAQLFEPFYQLDGSMTRPSEGLGMGLYVVRRLVEVYGGRVALASEDGWLTVEIRLRAARQSAQHDGAAERTSAVA